MQLLFVVLTIVGSLTIVVSWLSFRLLCGAAALSLARNNPQREELIFKTCLEVLRLSPPLFLLSNHWQRLLDRKAEYPPPREQVEVDLLICSSADQIQRTVRTARQDDAERAGGCARAPYHYRSSRAQVADRTSKRDRVGPARSELALTMRPPGRGKITSGKPGGKGKGGTDKGEGGKGKGGKGKGPRG